MIGGLLSSTVMTLIVLPTLYYIVERRRELGATGSGGSPVDPASPVSPALLAAAGAAAGAGALDAAAAAAPAAGSAPAASAPAVSGGRGAATGSGGVAAGAAAPAGSAVQAAGAVGAAGAAGAAAAASAPVASAPVSAAGLGVSTDSLPVVPVDDPVRAVPVSQPIPVQSANPAGRAGATPEASERAAAARASDPAADRDRPRTLRRGGSRRRAVARRRPGWAGRPDPDAVLKSLAVGLDAPETASSRRAADASRADGIDLSDISTVPASEPSAPLTADVPIVQRDSGTEQAASSAPQEPGPLGLLRPVRRPSPPNSVSPARLGPRTIVVGARNGPLTSRRSLRAPRSRG